MQEVSDRRLGLHIDGRQWESLLEILKPKFFPRDEKGHLADIRTMAKIADALINPLLATPNKVKIVLMKCLLNSCVNGYEHLSCDIQRTGINDYDFYSRFADVCEKFTNDISVKYPVGNSFPYDGVANWAVDYICNFSVESDNLKEELELLRLSIQFLCNLGKVSFECTKRELFEESIINLACHDHLPVSRAASAYIHNSLVLSKENCFTEESEDKLALVLMKPLKSGILPARDAVKHLLKKPGRFENIYEQIPMNERLYLLETIYQELRDASTFDDAQTFIVGLTSNVVSFLSERFRRKSDAILKTVASYLDGTEPMEIMILLDILGVLTSESSTESRIVDDLRNDKSLLINCVFLLKSLHMVGRESGNYFTPVQDLAELAPCAPKLTAADDKKEDIQAHPAFGFKAGLVRVIGNMAYKHESNQDLVRETDGIPLILDCCNMDARNPLIMQWSILAMRNISDNNMTNQDVVRALTKIGVADSSVLREMGITMHDDGDGRAIGIVPLKKGKNDPNAYSDAAS